MAADTLRSTHTACPTMNIITEKTATTFSTLKSTKSRSSVLMLPIIQFIRLTLSFHRLPCVSQTRPGQAAERRDFLRHLVEQSFDAHKTIAPGHIEYQLVQKLPFRSRIAS